MSWTTLKPDDILARLADGERAALARATGDLDDAILADVLGQTAALVRGYIGAHRGNALAAGALEIPPSLKSAALDLAVVAYSIRAAGTLLDPKGARAAARDAFPHLHGCGPIEAFARGSGACWPRRVSAPSRVRPH